MGSFSAISARTTSAAARRMARVLNAPIVMQFGFSNMARSWRKYRFLPFALLSMAANKTSRVAANSISSRFILNSNSIALNQPRPRAKKARGLMIGNQSLKIIGHHDSHRVVTR